MTWQNGYAKGNCTLGQTKPWGGIEKKKNKFFLTLIKLNN